ncbi:MAG: translation elongation factor Ts [Bacteroidota bacterium]|nr:translation elongation factor Ts [Bacteroidota bacterium]MDP4192115.1 translation elongation factor Ts [Bacteroidota bacterium]
MISADQVKLLREKTGAGMMDCKKALTEANGDFDKAIEVLRKKGAAVAAKRAERSANEGLVLTHVSDDKKSAVMVEVNCETDFVAKSDDFKNFASMVLDTIVKEKPANLDELLAVKHDGKPIAEELEALIGKIGEKIAITRFVIENSETGAVVDYVHHGSKLGVLVRADNIGNGDLNELTSILKDVAMQVAAMKPLFTFREEVPQTILDKEIDIYKELARKEGKPEQILDKIAQGKLNKYYQENCLNEQAFIKDNTKSVGELFNEYNKKYSTNTRLVLFRRFHLSDENK